MQKLIVEAFVSRMKTVNRLDLMFEKGGKEQLSQYSLTVFQCEAGLFCI